VAQTLLSASGSRPELRPEATERRRHPYNAPVQIFRARIFTPVADPFATDIAASYRTFDDGYLAVVDGRIAGVGDWSERPQDGEVIELGQNKLISPGFFDTHLHAPQIEMIGSYGGDLLQWLNRYTFPTEAKFADPKHAEVIARLFFDELLRNGTLCALIFSTIHYEATEIFFAEAERRGFRGIIGKNMMDRNAPDFLLEDPRTSYEQSRELLVKWHNRGLLRYAITPPIRADLDASAPPLCRRSEARVPRCLRAYPHLREQERKWSGCSSSSPRPSTPTSTTITACSTTRRSSRMASTSAVKSSIC